METKSTPQMKTSSDHGHAAMSSLGPETASPPASPRNANDNSKMLQTQFEQYGSLTSEPAIQWPKLKKVAPKTMPEVNKEPLPWMQKQLRRVQKEENISQQVREQKSADVELWRSQLRKISALDVDSLDHDEDVDHGDHKRAGTCLTCPREMPSSSPFLDDVATHTPDIPTKPSGAEREDQDDQDGQLHNFEQKRLEEIRALSSQRSSSRISTTTKVESTTVTHAYQVNESVYPTSESLTAKENIVDIAEQAGKELSRSRISAIEVFSPMPIMPPNHTCSWKDRYLNLTAEVRQLKAEILSQGRRMGSEHVDVGVDVGQGEDYGLGVEGLTIVMHLKGKDDLVINTDLTQASSDV
ncbi:hypothetical protein CTA2_3181 [Colletotrichum tanaceti]|uniref:Uncharacterized protein n=1 Tax=Colletotrichum tanaceti TaxID=1306861 RepID=A0A4U6XQJ0_9PEZI|nr:hypothetical protein CTA2_3181 [Colletotrichum tanaceti]TKW58074.1 hypothetical protein CTA1_11115 [Colletotrichum tanaceti]